MMEQIDCRGLACPMPMIKLKKYMAQKQGQDFEVNLKASDQGSLKDIPAFCQQQGLECELLGEGIEFVIRRSST